MRIIVQNDQRLEWVSWTWAMMVVLLTLAIVPLYFGIICLVEGSDDAVVFIGISVLAMILFAFFVGKRRVSFNKDTGKISLEFRSLLRQKNQSRDLGQLTGVLLYEEHSEGDSVLVDPNSRPSLNGVRYRVALSFQDGAELHISGNARKGSEAHRIAQVVLAWLGSSSNASITD